VNQLKNLSLKKLLVFKHYQIDPKEIKYPFQWWGKHDAMFAIVGFLACQILRIVGSQIEIERFFFFNMHIYKPKEMLVIIK
jgi:hypothetical protein